MNIFSVLRGSGHTKNIWLLSKPRQRSDSGNLPMDFLAFVEQTRKENNTYFFDLLIIENVELEIKGFCGERNSRCLVIERYKLCPFLL